MKYLIIVFFFLLSLPALGQTDSDSLLQYKRLKKSEESFAKKLDKAQLGLDSSIILYKEVDQGDQNLVRAQCKSYLFQLFDLSLEKREEEIVQLQGQLERIAKRDQNIDKFNDLIKIKEEIELVQNEIFKRKKNRDKIVEARLKELLP